MSAELDTQISDKTKRRKTEASGRTIALQLVSGEKIYGQLVKHEPNVLHVQDWNDNNMVKDIHRAMVKRFVILLRGGSNESDK